MITTGRIAVLSLLLGLAGAGALRPLEAQEPSDTAQLDQLRLEVRGRPPTPQVLTVRPRDEPDWSRSIVEHAERVDPAILGAPPSLELRIVPVEIPAVHSRLLPDEGASDDETDGPPAGRPGTRDPPDPR